MKKNLNIVGFITALVLLTSAVFKINHLPGGAFTMVISGVALSIYLPFFIIDKLKEKTGGVTVSRNVIAGISASLINLGITFKFQHWPSANILLILGVVGFAFVYLPMVLTQKLKDGSNRSALMYACGALGLTLFANGILFKIMHWPGAVAMLLLSVALLFLGYFLPYIQNKEIPSETKSNYLRNAFFVIIIGSMMVTFFTRSILEQSRKQEPTQATAQLATSENCLASTNN